MAGKSGKRKGKKLVVSTVAMKDTLWGVLRVAKKELRKVVRKEMLMAASTAN